MFDLSKFPVVPKEDYYTPIERDGPPQKDGKNPPTVNLEEQFRAVMAKLSVCGSTLKPVPSGCSFTVAIELKDLADPPLGHPQPWIPVQPSLQKEAVKPGSDNLDSSPGDDLGGIRTTPIRAVEAGEMVFEMWIEEGKAKMDSSESGKSSQVVD
jgi:mitotic spindle assembly checkpoint protein MAD2B